MGKKTRFITKIAVPVVALVVGIGLVFVCCEFYRAYKHIEMEKEKLGYKTPCKALPAPLFTRVGWKGVLIDADITYTDGAHNIVPYDLDKNGKVELIANSYRSDTLILYKYNNDPHDSSNWSRYVIDSSVGGGIPTRPIHNFISSTIKKRFSENLQGEHITQQLPT